MRKRLNSALDINPQRFTPEEALDLAKCGQITTDFSVEIKRSAAQLSKPILDIFPGHAQIVYVLTAPERRHAWFMYLAETGSRDPECLRRDLLVKSTRRLVTETFGSVPPGFLKILKDIPAVYKGHGLYAKLHCLLSENPDLAGKLVAVELDEEMVELLIHLPKPFRNMKVARAFGGLRKLETFKGLCDVLAPEKPDQFKTSLELVMKGAAVERLMWRIYENVRFPQAVLNDHPSITHIKMGCQLMKLANEWENCVNLYVEEALRNELQFYIMTLSSGEEIMFSLKNDLPFGWYLGETKDRKNECLDIEQRIELEEMLDDLGFGQTESMTNQIRSFLCDCAQAQKWRRRRVAGRS